MSEIIHLDEARMRRDAAKPVDPVLMALDVLALALAEHGHRWTAEERDAYEAAVVLCGGAV